MELFVLLQQFYKERPSLIENHNNVCSVETVRMNCVERKSSLGVHTNGQIEKKYHKN